MRKIMIAIAVITAISLVGAAAGLGNFFATDQGSAPQVSQVDTPKPGGTRTAGTPAAGTVGANGTPQPLSTQDIVVDRQAFILLNPATVRPGSSVGVTGSGFDPGAQIDLTLKKKKDDKGQSIGFVQADKGGSFGGFSFTLPDTFTNGSFILVAVQHDGQHETSAAGNLTANSPVVTFGTQVGKPGDVIAFSMKGFAPRESVKVYWNSLGSREVATLQMDEGGGLLSGSIPVPFGAVGNNSFIFMGETSQSPVTVQFLMLNLYPVASINSYAAKADTTLQFTGTGFGPGERIRVYLNSVQAAPVEILDADETGAFTAAGNFVIPFDLKAKNTFILIGEQSQAPTTVSFDVLPYTPYAEASTYGGRPGTTITFYGQGFARNEVVHIVVGRAQGSPGQEVSCAVTDNQGSLVAGGSYTIPYDAQVGKMNFVLGGSKSKSEAVATMEVMDAGGPVPAPSGGQAQQPFQCPYNDADPSAALPQASPAAGTPAAAPAAGTPAAATPAAGTPALTPQATQPNSPSRTPAAATASPQGTPSTPTPKPSPTAVSTPTPQRSPTAVPGTPTAQPSPTGGQGTPGRTGTPAGSPTGVSGQSSPSASGTPSAGATPGGAASPTNRPSASATPPPSPTAQPSPTARPTQPAAGSPSAAPSAAGTPGR